MADLTFDPYGTQYLVSSVQGAYKGNDLWEYLYFLARFNAYVHANRDASEQQLRRAASSIRYDYKQQVELGLGSWWQRVPMTVYDSLTELDPTNVLKTFKVSVLGPVLERYIPANARLQTYSVREQVKGIVDDIVANTRGIAEGNPAAAKVLNENSLPLGDNGVYWDKPSNLQIVIGNPTIIKTKSIQKACQTGLAVKLDSDEAVTALLAVTKNLEKQYFQPGLELLSVINGKIDVIQSELVLFGAAIDAIGQKVDFLEEWARRGEVREVLRQAAQLEAQLRQQSLQAAGYAVDVLTRLVAFSDPELARQLAAFGNFALFTAKATFELGDALTSLSEAKAAVAASQAQLAARLASPLQADALANVASTAGLVAGAAGLNFVLGIASAALSLASALDGQDPNTLVMQQLQVISGQIQALAQNVDRRFDRVDAALRGVLEGLSGIAADVQELRRGLWAVRADVSQILVTAYGLANTSRRIEMDRFLAETDTVLRKLDGYDRSAGKLLPPTGADSFGSFHAELVVHATANATGSAALANAPPRNTSWPGAVRELAETTLDQDLGYLNDVLVAHGIPGFADTTPANPEVWGAAAFVLATLTLDWPEYAVGNAAAAVTRAEVLQVGSDIERALASIMVQWPDDGGAPQGNDWLFLQLHGIYTDALVHLTRLGEDFLRSWFYSHGLPWDIDLRNNQAPFTPIRATERALSTDQDGKSLAGHSDIYRLLLGLLQSPPDIEIFKEDHGLWFPTGQKLFDGVPRPWMFVYLDMFWTMLGKPSRLSVRAISDSSGWVSTGCITCHVTYTDPNYGDVHLLSAILRPRYAPEGSPDPYLWEFETVTGPPWPWPAFNWQSGDFRGIPPEGIAAVVYPYALDRVGQPVPEPDPFTKMIARTKDDGQEMAAKQRQQMLADLAEDMSEFPGNLVQYADTMAGVYAVWTSLLQAGAPSAMYSDDTLRELCLGTERVPDKALAINFIQSTQATENNPLPVLADTARRRIDRLLYETKKIAAAYASTAVRDVLPTVSGPLQLLTYADRFVTARGDWDMVAQLPLLSRGTSSRAVVRLHALLSAALNTPTSLPGDVFTADTEAAVKTVQINNGLYADGIAGAYTWAVLLGIGDYVREHPAEREVTIRTSGGPYLTGAGVTARHSPLSESAARWHVTIAELLRAGGKKLIDPRTGKVIGYLGGRVVGAEVWISNEDTGAYLTCQDARGHLITATAPMRELATKFHLRAQHPLGSSAIKDGTAWTLTSADGLPVIVRPGGGRELMTGEKNPGAQADALTVTLAEPVGIWALEEISQAVLLFSTADGLTLGTGEVVSGTAAPTGARQKFTMRAADHGPLRHHSKITLWTDTGRPLAVENNGALVTVASEGAQPTAFTLSRFDDEYLRDGDTIRLQDADHSLISPDNGGRRLECQPRGGQADLEEFQVQFTAR